MAYLSSDEKTERLDLSGDRTLIMGVLNVTNDSFSDGGSFLDVDNALKRAFEMVEAGADILDIGGESSRPGASPISEKEEISRVLPVLKMIKEKIKIPISIDTYKSKVAEAALAEGAMIINDITALSGDDKMAEVVAGNDAFVVLMHMKGSPIDMQQDPQYEDLIGEICDYLRISIEKARAAGIEKDKIIVDPGIGFGKTLEHNLSILKNLKEFKRLGKPVLVGPSRKSFLGEVTGREVHERVMATSASISASIMNGASIVRVHDVELMHDVVMVSDAIKNARFG